MIPQDYNNSGQIYSVTSLLMTGDGKFYDSTPYRYSGLKHMGCFLIPVSHTHIQTFVFLVLNYVVVRRRGAEWWDYCVSWCAG